MANRSSILARRAVHQYRRRDVFSYLGLRLYLATDNSAKDAWARNVAVNLVLRRKSAGYIQVDAFKERRGYEFLYRSLHLPSPNEIIAETALIDACARAGGKFTSLGCVFSYQLPESEDTSGVYKPYFTGFADRHAAIANSCRMRPRASVVYLDLKKFYPTIKLELAKAVWLDACSSTDLDSSYRDLGLKLLSDYELSGPIQNPERSVLTGPMFSHLIGNLVLRDLDIQMTGRTDIDYFRYVDDIALVGSDADLQRAESEVKQWCHLHSLSLNHDKRLVVRTEEWLTGADDFAGDTVNYMWAALVGRTKRLLLVDASNADILKQLFQSSGVRIPLLDYSKLARETKFLKRIYELSKQLWFKWRQREEDALSLVGLAAQLRFALIKELGEKLENLDNVSAYQRKRKIYRLRFVLSRLIYLAEPNTFAIIAEKTAAIPELIAFCEIFRTLSNGDVADLLPYGTSVAHVVAQAVSTTDMKLRCTRRDWEATATIQAWSVFAAYGVELEGFKPPRFDIVELCDWDRGSIHLMQSKDPYIQEIACLHGVSPARRHDDLLRSAFDTDDNVAFDIVDLVAGSY